MYFGGNKILKSFYYLAVILGEDLTFIY